MTSNALITQQRTSLEALGLVLPFPVWLALFLIYFSGLGILGFAPSDAQTLRGIAMGVNMFIMGIFCAFKFPLWIPKQ